MKITEVNQWTPLVLWRRLKRERGYTRFIVREPLDFGYSIEGEPRREFTVPPGFETDLASVPKFARALVSKTDLIEASVIHDYLYAGGPGGRPVVPKTEADDVYLAFAEKAGDPWLLRNLAWAAVALFGHYAYNTYEGGTNE